MDAVAACGLESAARARAGTMQANAKINKPARTSRWINSNLLCNVNVFNKTLPNLKLATPRSSRVRWNFPADGTL
jgi:hypothetical protein